MDFDDDLFEVKPAKVRHHMVKALDYTARIVSDGVSYLDMMPIAYLTLTILLYPTDSIVVRPARK
jgi:hypothetical protein